MQFYYKVWNFLGFYNPVHLQENSSYFQCFLVYSSASVNTEVKNAIILQRH